MSDSRWNGGWCSLKWRMREGKTKGVWQPDRKAMGYLERTASKHVYYLGWNRSPAQAGCMRQVLGPGALGRPRGIGWKERWERGSRWGIHVNPWLIHVNVWQKPLQYCKVISPQLIKINEKRKEKKRGFKRLETFIKWNIGVAEGRKGENWMIRGYYSHRVG